MSDDQISIKDIYGELHNIKGRLETVTSLASRVTEAEKDVLVLQTNQKNIDKAQENLFAELRDGQKQSQRILVYIGVIAILAGAFGDTIINKLAQ